MQTVRDWVLRFNANGPEGLLDGKAPSPRPVLGAEHKRARVNISEQQRKEQTGNDCGPPEHRKHVRIDKLVDTGEFQE